MTERAARMAEYSRTVKKKPEHLKYKSDSIANVPRTCVVCGTAFLATPGAVRRTGGLICSNRCRGIRAAVLTPKRDTSIERAIEAALVERRWRFEKQVPIGGVSIVDFFLPDYAIVLYCDGVYWHSLPKAIERAETQNSELKRMGYTVFRFTESNIKQSPTACLDSVAEFLGTLAR